MKKKTSPAEARIDYNLLAYINHDVRSPFNGLIGFSDILAQNINRLPKEKAEEYAIIISDLANKSHLNIQLVLCWIKLISENYKPNVTVGSWQQVFNHVKVYNASDIKAKGLELIIETDHSHVLADQTNLAVAFALLVAQITRYSEPSNIITIRATSSSVLVKSEQFNENISELFHIFFSEDDYSELSYGAWITKQLILAQPKFSIPPNPPLKDTSPEILFRIAP
jgi:K+-sensing histidine kinase KdpD